MIKKNKLLIHIALLLTTFITTIFAGYDWTVGQAQQIEFSSLITHGLEYSIAILLFLSAHEFGHYFAAKYHKVETTLPYYIPVPPILGMLNFGTMGAVIKTKSPIKNNRAMFDIGVSGPIAGFIVSALILIYGFTHLPTIDYLLNIHPDFFNPDYGKDAISLEFGNTISYSILKFLFADPKAFIPPLSEIYHYPYLCVGWFGLFVTSMNLIPVGQLDGGHIIYSMFGEKKHEAIASISFIIILILGFGSIISEALNLKFSFGWSGWLLWSLILYFIIKIKHPPVENFSELDNSRKIVGWISIIIMIISFSPSPFILSVL